MSAFSSLSEFWQTMLPFIMLVEIVFEIGLFIYQLLRSNKPVRSLLSLAVMAVMIPLLFSVSQADSDNIGDAFMLFGTRQYRRTSGAANPHPHSKVRCKQSPAA